MFLIAVPLEPHALSCADVVTASVPETERTLHYGETGRGASHNEAERH